LNYLDIIIAIPLLWGAYKGFKRGLIFEIAMIIGLILGIYMAFKFSDIFETFLKKYFDASSALPYISFIMIFIIIILLMVFLAKFLEKILKIANINAFNKIAGAVFGLIKFTLLVSIILTLFRPVNEKIRILKKVTADNSVLYKPISNASQYIFPALGDVQKVLQKKL
jgi:membrane protein required for colicin V production